MCCCLRGVALLALMLLEKHRLVHMSSLLLECFRPAPQEDGAGVDACIFTTCKGGAGRGGAGRGGAGGAFTACKGGAGRGGCMCMSISCVSLHLSMGGAGRWCEGYKYIFLADQRVCGIEKHVLSFPPPQKPCREQCFFSLQQPCREHVRCLNTLLPPSVPVAPTV
jgi:hypothetical protein